MRIDDHLPILRDHPAETVFAAWRSAMIADTPDRPEKEIRSALLVGVERADAAARRAAARIVPDDPDLAQRALRAGLGGMRSAPPGDPLSFGVADGVGDMGEAFCWQTAARSREVGALALWTDGWVSPAQSDLATWMEAAAAVHKGDPHRTGPFQCVKGPGTSGRHDDMGPVLIRRSE